MQGANGVKIIVLKMGKIYIGRQKNIYYKKKKISLKWIPEVKTNTKSNPFIGTVLRQINECSQRYFLKLYGKILHKLPK